MKSIEDFKSQIASRGGIAKSSLFRVIVSGAPQPKDIADPSGESIMFLCESASFPGRTIGTVDVTYQNNPIKVPHSFGVEDVTMTFVLTNDFYIKKVLDAWQGSLINRSSYRVNFKKAYTRDIQIQELDMTGKIIYAVILRNAYPVSINAVDVSVHGEDILKVTAVFTYEDFEAATTITGGEPDQSAAAKSVTEGALVDRGVYTPIVKDIPDFLIR